METEVLSDESIEIECLVCAGPASHVKHYGSTVCYSCRAFFRRSARRRTELKRYANCHGKCFVDHRTRTRCKWCRFLKCLKVGMVLERVDRRGRKSSKPGRPNCQPVREIENLPQIIVSPYNVETMNEDDSYPNEVFQDNRNTLENDSHTLDNRTHHSAVITNSIETAMSAFYNLENAIDDIVPDTINEITYDNFTTIKEVQNIENNHNLSSKDSSEYSNIDYSETCNIVQESYSNSDPYNVSSFITDPDYTVTSIPSFNPSIDLTAEEELKMHMLFEVRIKCINEITERIASFPDSCEKMKIFLMSITAKNGIHTIQSQDLLAKPGETVNKFSLGGMAMRISKSYWPTILDFRDIYHKVKFDCVSQVCFKAYPVIVGVYNRLLLKVNEHSGGFLEQHNAAGLLSPHIQNLYNKAVHGTVMESKMVPSFDPLPFSSPEFSTSKKSNITTALMRLIRGDRVIQDLVFFLILLTPWPLTSSPDTAELRLARNEICLLTYRYLKLRKRLGPILANEHMQNILSAVHSLYTGI